MSHADDRQHNEAVIRNLAAIGVFRKSQVSPFLTVGEVGEIAHELGLDVVDTAGGWSVCLSSSTLASQTLRRIAGALGDEPSLCRVPRHEVLASIVKAIDHYYPELSEHFESYPDDVALNALLHLAGCGRDKDWVDFSPVTDWIAPVNQREERILHHLKMSLDCNLSSARLLREIGMSGGRTTFNDTVLPAVPFILGGTKGEPIRLLGQRPSPERLKQREHGTYLGLKESDDKDRLLVKYRLTEEAVETASFHIPAEAKQIVAGSYFEEQSGATISFNLDTKHARKLAGLRTVIRSNFPDYVAGQHVCILLDKANGAAHVEVLNATDYDGDERMLAMLNEVPAPTMHA